MSKLKYLLERLYMAGVANGGNEPNAPDGQKVIETAEKEILDSSINDLIVKYIGKSKTCIPGD